jgi:hypothetical protein
MKPRLTFLLPFLTTALLACNLPLPPSPAAASPSLTVITAPAASAMPTLLAAQHYFFQEDFSADPSGWSTVVTSGDPDLLDLRAIDGSLVFDIGAKNLDTLSLFQTTLYKNIWLDVKLVNSGGTAYAADLVCRYNKEEGWYQAEVFQSGAYNLYYMTWTEDMKPSPLLLADGVSDVMKPGSTPNILSLICKERTLSLYINGRLAVSYVDNQYVLSTGQVGIGVASFEKIPVRVSVDWVKFETP